MKTALKNLDLSPYAGRWVAIVRGRLAGVGRTADEARLAAQASRPKEKAELHFVAVDDWRDFALLRRLWGFIRRRGAKALLVGGAVRDGLLGRPLHDLDFVVDGNATALAAAVGRAFHGALVPLDPGRDTARVVIRYAGRHFNLDFARRQGDDWVADLRARDFTVNAIAVDPAGRYLDPLDGREDLAHNRLRAASTDAFRDDPLRTLRAVRLVAEMGLTIEPETEHWIRRDAPLLPRVAAERMRDEFARILAAPGSARHLLLLDDLGLLAQILPEVKAIQGVEQTPPHQWEVWTHTRMTLDALEGIMGALEENGATPAGRELAAPGWVWGDLNKRLRAFHVDLAIHLKQTVSDERDRRLTLKLAALLHDVGKPSCRSVGEDNRIHFYNHDQVGAEMAAERLRMLRFSGDEIALVKTIITHHMRPAQLGQIKGPTRRAIYRYFKATGAEGIEVALLSMADMLGIWGDTLPHRKWQRKLDVVATLLSAFFDRSEVVTPPPLIDGHELMQALALRPGPEVGRLLEAIREAQAMGEVKTREAALDLAEKLKREE